jgi:hypothetical protein
MRYFNHLILSLLVLAPAGGPASAQQASQDSAVTDCPPSVAALASCYAAKLDTGAYVLAALPQQWNGVLVVLGHGGPFVVPPSAKDEVDSVNRNAALVQRGFGWVASSYRKEGYGVAMAVEDSDQARKFFIERVAKPRRIVYHGQSYGGLVGAKLIESFAKNRDGGLNYDGALFQSGALAGALLTYEHRADLRAVYQYYCKNLPRPNEAQYPVWSGIPSESKMTIRELTVLVDECTGISLAADARSASQKQNLADILAVMGYPETLLVRHLQAATLTFRDIAERITGGRNPFTNVGVQYKGSHDDAALNSGVARFTADPGALAALNADGRPTGVLPIPVVTIHSINDPQVLVEVESAYRETVTAAGSSDHLVQAYTDERGHVLQSPPEVAAALDSLMQWIEKGAKPSAQSIAAMCDQVKTTLDGPCRYHPEYSPKSYATRYYPREAAVR